MPNSGSNTLSANVKIDTSSANRSINSLVKNLDRIHISLRKIGSANDAERSINNAANAATKAQQNVQSAVQRTAQVESAALASKKAQEQAYWNQYLQRYNTQKQYEQQRTQDELNAIKKRLLAESAAEDERRVRARKAVKDIEKQERAIERQKAREAKLIEQNRKAEERAAKQQQREQEKINRQIQKEAEYHRKAQEAIDRKNASLKIENRQANLLTRNLRALISAYVGLMGVQAITSASDTITSAENKLNVINANNLGSSGYTESGGFSKATLDATQSSMDKMYTAAMNSRTAYADVMSNVSKSMTLAPDAFQGNIDNAIRFQEIMGKAYSLGGASAAEKSSSMYQMIQALGSGVLQGDELRSVREGAPLAYKAIEKFAQGVLNTTDSLKTLGSEGKITSDLVVAAIMNMGSEVDSQFGNMSLTFEDSWAMFKSTALKAFEPVLQKLNDILNKIADSSAVDAFTTALVGMANIFNSVLSFMESNWSWFQYIVYAGAIILISILNVLAIVALKNLAILIGKMLVVNASLLPILAIITAIVLAIGWLVSTSESACDFITGAIIILTAIIIACIIKVTKVLLAAELTVAGIFVLISLLIVGVILGIAYLFFKFTGQFIGTLYGLRDATKAICENINNFGAWLFNSLIKGFWTLISAILTGFEFIAPLLDKLAELSGSSWTFSGTMKNIDSKIQAADDRANAAKSGYVSVGDAWDTGYNEGYEKGVALQNKINEWGSNLKSKLEVPIDDSYADSYDQTAALDNINKNLADTADNTEQIKDSVALSEEDLTYLRKIAAMEWKKEFTSVNIEVAMNNNNTISGEGDLDGLITKLTTKLEEELASTASGIYN